MEIHKTMSGRIVYISGCTGDNPVRVCDADVSHNRQNTADEDCQLEVFARQIVAKAKVGK